MIDNFCFKTDFFFLKEGGMVSDFEEYILVQTPDNPTFYFGNYLLLKNAPKSDQRLHLEKQFDENFADSKETQHYNFCWTDLSKEDYSEFTKAGYKYEVCLSLVAYKDDLIVPKRLNEEVEIRAFESKSDWEKWLELEISEREPGSTEDGFTVYIERKMAKYLKMHEKGKGNFYGAFINDELLASAGMYFEDRVGRFQTVVTRTKHRRKGICTTLIYTMMKKYFQSLDYLVIVAVEGYHALDIYKNLGFKEKDYQVSLCLADRNTKL